MSCNGYHQLYYIRNKMKDINVCFIHSLTVHHVFCDVTICRYCISLIASSKSIILPCFKFALFCLIFNIFYHFSLFCLLQYQKHNNCFCTRKVQVRKNRRASDYFRFLSLMQIHLFYSSYRL